MGREDPAARREGPGDRRARGRGLVPAAGVQKAVQAAQPLQPIHSPLPPHPTGAGRRRERRRPRERGGHCGAEPMGLCSRPTTKTEVGHPLPEQQW